MARGRPDYSILKAPHNAPGERPPPTPADLKRFWVEFHATNARNFQEALEAIPVQAGFQQGSHRYEGVYDRPTLVENSYIYFEKRHLASVTIYTPDASNKEELKELSRALRGLGKAISGFLGHHGIKVRDEKIATDMTTSHSYIEMDINGADYEKARKLLQGLVHGDNGLTPEFLQGTRPLAHNELYANRKGPDFENSPGDKIMWHILGQQDDGRQSLYNLKTDRDPALFAVKEIQPAMAGTIPANSLPEARVSTSNTTATPQSAPAAATRAKLSVWQRLKKGMTP